MLALAMSWAAFSAFTEPPYWMQRLLAAASP